MNSQDFRYVSLVGRVAFGINCLENTLIFLKLDINKWNPVLQDLWAFTSAEFIDDWNGLLAEILPECILENKNYNDEYEYIDENKFYYLQELYQNIDQRIDFLINCVFQIGQSHTYSVIINHGPESLKCLQTLIAYMNQNSLPIPAIKKYEDFPIAKSDWCDRYNGRSLSIRNIQKDQLSGESYNT